MIRHEKTVCRASPPPLIVKCGQSFNLLDALPALAERGGHVQRRRRFRKQGEVQQNQEVGGGKGGGGGGGGGWGRAALSMKVGEGGGDLEGAGEGKGGFGQGRFVHEGDGGRPVAVAIEGHVHNPAVDYARERLELLGDRQVRLQQQQSAQCMLPRCVRQCAGRQTMRSW